MVPISDDLFRDFLNCKYKASLKISGKCGQKSDYENLQAALLRDYRHQAEQSLLQSLRADAVVDHDPASLSEAIGRGPAAITSANAIADGMACHFDALVRVSASSSRAEYLPVLYRYANQVSKDDKLLLAFCGLALTRLQGGKVPIGKIISGSEYATAKVQLAKLLGPAKKALQRLVDLQASPAPLTPRLNDHCSICEFNEHCRAIAREKDDLSLLRGLKEQEIVRLNSKGIFTVTQYSYTFRLRKRQVKGPNHGHKHDLALQAMAIRTGKMYVTETPQVALSDTKLYLDVEGLPDRGLCYLIGLLQCNGPVREYHPFWADGPSDEETIWKSFMAHIGTLKDFTLFHYGVFDVQTLRRMYKRYGGDSSEFDRLSAASCNVLATIYSRVYFPAYSNGLKNVAGHLGFKWTDEKASGIQSIVWRNRWEATKDENFKHTLLTYNREDCLALRTVTEAIREVAAEGASKHFVQANDVPNQNHHYRNQEFFFSELDRVNKCAYFDYQRSRVYARTAPAVKASLRRRASNLKAAQRVNKEVAFGPPSKCPQCGQNEWFRRVFGKKVVYDLRLTKSGITRSVVFYKTWEFLCSACKSTYIPPDYKAATASKYGRTLMAWAVNHVILLRSSWTVTAENLQDIFGYSLGRGTIGYFKRKLAAYYENTYAAIMEKLRHGNLVHADETEATTGYVWVFTNLEEVLFVYNATREGDTAKDTLKGFQGILVSDFYAAYDSVPCVQQKCLIHLIRDMNDDLFKNPFDEEFKQLGRAFTSVIVPIVETIDRFGLKKAHLQKHKAAAQRFLQEVVGHEYGSAVARSYQARFAKFQDKLFRFLDYDGVPWNNNNAENAVKRFAYLRAVIGGAPTPEGMREYLILLSICETLRRKNVSFLRFLVSGCTDIDEFVAAQSRKGAKTKPSK